jgi:hypothetical protein
MLLIEKGFLRGGVAHLARAHENAPEARRAIQPVVDESANCRAPDCNGSGSPVQALSVVNEFVHVFFVRLVQKLTVELPGAEDGCFHE